MEKLCLSLLFLLLISVPIISETDYSNIKGDFKIFCLKDSPETIKAKVNYLCENGQTDAVALDRLWFYGSMLDSSYSCKFEFYKEQVYAINITFYGKYITSDLDLSLKTFIEEKLKPLFVNKYGSPTKNYGYPNIFQLKEGYITYISKWILTDKTIIIGVQQNDFCFYPKIIISDNKLSAEKEIENKKLQEAKIKNAEDDF